MLRSFIETFEEVERKSAVILPAFLRIRSVFFPEQLLEEVLAVGIQEERQYIMARAWIAGIHLAESPFCPQGTTAAVKIVREGKHLMHDLKYASKFMRDRCHQKLGPFH